LGTFFWGGNFEGGLRILGLYAGRGTVLGHNFPVYF